ncbi:MULTISPECIES: molybdenum cofactor guanylyltransferase [Pyrobaculum]|uniref:Molybdenum cofactor guanylyltransferase n=2 Tax=Pyrobaculum arsenaticum TaxID=121277 RepID=A4WM01_PYRAR|nr:molybdenum cofactor guanylyltransferase [Pyrobaculum arsenaticum]ABP51418.1 molybdenum cofactor guanylyltransferase [Pyrobaculum arsenaticum DSM 13514]MCY0889935.1 molybdenum cofactor guanylyltransferase [Pyrobaculum arsenaticum]NYR16212.1 molybdenum cofactor guanylyltransferase [Pyrobaculum arsenaticum]
MVVLVILAGGASRRFGRDKCTYEYRGKRLIDYVIEAGNELGAKIVIAAGRNAAFYQGEEVIEDSDRFSGPLAAVDTATRRFEEELVFAPCDTPFIKPTVFEKLISADAPLAVWVFPNGRVESTIFKARPQNVSVALDLLAQHKRRRVDDLFRIVATKFLSVVKHGISPKWVHNINTPRDLETETEATGEIFVEDYLISWDVPPLIKWLRNGDVEALRGEFLRYVEVGLLSMAAHVAKDLSHVGKGYAVLAEAIYGAVEVNKRTMRGN